MSHPAQTNLRLEYNPAAADMQPEWYESVVDRIKAAEPELQVEDVFPVPSWFHDQVSWIEDPPNSNSRIYNLPIVLRIQGPIVEPAFISAVMAVQRRHQSLRSLYRIVDGRPVQVVLQPTSPSVPITNAEAAEEKDDYGLETLVREETSRPFDVRKEPAFRYRLLRSAADNYVLVITTHHLVCDDWSIGILARQIFEGYQAMGAASLGAAIEPTNFQYSDFIRWHQERLRGKGLESRISFWREYLSAKDESQHLETDHPRPAIRTWAGATLKEVLPEDLTTSLKLLSQRERVSLFMTLLAAFQCVLHRNSGETDIAVGSCAANRSLTTAEGVVGRFANDLVIRTDFSGCQTFRELLNRVRTQALTAFSNQDLPFAKLTDELKPRTPIGCNPLFQVMFILQDAPKGELSCPGLRVDRLAFDMGTAKYDLCVLLSLQQGVEIAFEYNTALFERATIEQLFDQFKAILRGMVGDPSGLISDGKCTTQALRPTLVAGDNDLHSPSPIEDSVLSKLVDIWETGFHKRPIGTDDDFFELGGDSLLAAGLFAQINKAFDVTIPIVNLIEAPTIRKLATIVRSSRLPREMRCAVLLQNGGSRPPLFCIHGQSGNLLVYREFAKYLGHDQPVYGLQPLGLDGRHRPLTRIEDMASTYLQEMQLIQPREPYFLAGYCMGGLIALEMATQLLGKGLSVGLLALIDTYNVGLMKPTRIDDVAFAFQKCWFGWNHFLRMDTKYRLTYLKRRFGELGNEPSEVSDANEVAALSYVPAPYPGKLLHIYPSHQYSRYKRSELAWNGLAGGGVEELALPIYPGQMFEEASACKLAAKVNSYIGASCCGENETRRPIAVPCCW